MILVLNQPYSDRTHFGAADLQGYSDYNCSLHLLSVTAAIIIDHAKAARAGSTVVSSLSVSLQMRSWNCFATVSFHQGLPLQWRKNKIG